MTQTGVTCVSGGGAIYVNLLHFLDRGWTIYVNLLDFEKCKSFAFLKFFFEKI